MDSSHTPFLVLIIMSGLVTGVLGTLQPYGPHISDHMILSAGLQPNRDVKVR